MYKRDVGILLLAVWAVFVSLRREGPITFQKAWYLKFDGGHDSPHGMIPRPHSVDLNGDGKPEFVTTTPGGDKLILAAPRKGGDGFQEALVLAELDVGSIAGKGARVISLAHGSLDPPLKDFVHSARKQVVAALCSDGQLMLLDSNLKLKWKTPVPGLGVSGPGRDGRYGEIEDVDLRDVSLIISPHGVNDREKGMVVVSFRKETIRDDADYDGASDEDYDEYEHEREDDEELRHERGRDRNQNLEEVDVDPQTKYGTRHVFYFAFAGGSGNLVWTHRPEDFRKDPRNLVEHGVKTLYTDRLMTELDSSVHFGERSCRDYRESVLASLPHAWFGAEDSAIRVAHFHRHRKHHGNQKHNLQQNSGESLMSWQQKQQKKGPSSTSSTSASTSADTTAAATTTRVIYPNVLVSHTEDAMEVIHLYTGRPVCRIPLDRNVLHVDVNGDGVVDHVHALGGTPKIRTATHVAGHERIGACMARVTSGIPASVHLFNGTVCSSGAIKAGGPIDVAPPVNLAVPGKHGHYTSTLRQKSYVFFFNSRGEVSSFDHHGEKLFTEHTGIVWRRRLPNFAEDEDERDDDGGADDGNVPISVPTFEAFPFRRHAIPSGVLAAGSGGVTIFSEHGRELWSGELPHVPIQKLIVIDVNFDGLNDLVLVSEEGLFGWVQYRSPGGGGISALAGGMLVVMLVIIAQNVGGSAPGVAGTSGRRRGYRSTDRVD